MSAWPTWSPGQRAGRESAQMTGSGYMLYSILLAQSNAVRGCLNLLRWCCVCVCVCGTTVCTYHSNTKRKRVSPGNSGEKCMLAAWGDSERGCTHLTATCRAYFVDEQLRNCFFHLQTVSACQQPGERVTISLAARPMCPF